MTTTWKHHRYSKRDWRWLWLTHRDYVETTTLHNGTPALTQTFEKGTGERIASRLRDFEWEHDINLAAWMAYASIAMSTVAIILSAIVIALSH